MHDSVSKLNIVPELILVDGNTFKPYYHNDELIENICVIGGDDKYLPELHVQVYLLKNIMMIILKIFLKVMKNLQIMDGIQICVMALKNI